MEQLSILKVLKPQGIKGELKCLPLVEQTEIFASLKSVFYNGKVLNLISSTYRLGFVYIMLDGVNSIEEAEKFRGKIFYAEKDILGKLADKTFFIDELVGLTVTDTDDDKIGEILGVENYGATDILQVKDKWATYLVPFVKKIFVEIDVENKKVVVNRAEYEEHKV